MNKRTKQHIATSSTDVSSFQPECADDITMRFFFGLVPNDFNPENAIRRFWEKYHPMQCRDIAFQFKICTSLTAERLRPIVDLDAEQVNEFYDDLQSLLMAVYFIDRNGQGNGKPEVKKGGSYAIQ